MSYLMTTAALAKGRLKQGIRLSFDDYSSGIADKFLLLCQEQPHNPGNLSELEVVPSIWFPGAWAGPQRNKLDKARAPDSFMPFLLLQLSSLPLQTT